MHQSKLWCGRDQIERGRGSGDFAAGATVADGDVLLNSQHSGRGTEIDYPTGDASSHRRFLLPPARTGIHRQIFPRHSTIIHTGIKINRNLMLACNYPGCTAKYRRKEHLARHARKHIPTAQRLTCETCNKAFDRSDSLRRHRQLHLRGEGESSVSRTARACDHCHASKTRCNGIEPCNGCSRRGITCTFSRLAKRGVNDDNSHSPAPADRTGGTTDTSMTSDCQTTVQTSFSSREIQDLLIQHENNLREKGLLVQRSAVPSSGEQQEAENQDLDMDY
ncbi:hypothetical protein CNMCM8980_006013 [Aspergillus fumigatiaffinis]|nr:hypothetical protein CNMCM6457_004884 [Aspergillus fumigatiaffinis]KAF4229914.1 hypothetical protein CNMCM8980_006013 [Aspergillus fumigatiaffinis]